METLLLKIDGMACGGCASSVANALLAVDGVGEAEVSHAEATAKIHYDPDRTTPEQLRAAVEAAGYKAN